MPLFLSCFLRVTLLVRSPLLLSPLEVNGWSPPLSPPVFAREPIITVPTAGAGSHHSYGMDSAKRRFRANCIMKVFFNDCQASNQCVQR